MTLSYIIINFNLLLLLFCVSFSLLSHIWNLISWMLREEKRQNFIKAHVCTLCEEEKHSVLSIKINGGSFFCWTLSRSHVCRLKALMKENVEKRSQLFNQECVFLFRLRENSLSRDLILNLFYTLNCLFYLHSL